MGEKKLSKDWLEGFESVENWLESLLARRKGKPLSDSMKNSYISRMRGFVKFFRAGGDLEATPDSILEWAKTVESEEIVKVLNKYSIWLQGLPVDGYEIRTKIMRDGELRYPKNSEGSADQASHGVVRGFFTHNKLWLPKSGKRSNGRGATKKNDESFAIFRVDPNSNMIVSDYSELRYFLGFLTARDKLIALSILSTSQDPVDILGLNVGFVRGQVNRARLSWSGNRTKTGEEFRTFFSKSITEDLKKYVATERAEAEDNDPLFVRRSVDKKTKKYLGVTPANISDNFLKASRKAGFINGKTQNPFRPKRMRSIFASACYQAKIDDGIKNIFMGHASNVGQKYREIPPANLELEYARVEPFISVYAQDQSRELSETRQKSQRALDLALDIREENKNLREMIGNLAEKLGQFDGMIARIEELESIIAGESPPLTSAQIERLSKFKPTDEEIKRADEIKRGSKT